jgi:hypothetical protein
LHTCVAAVGLALALRFSPFMGFIKDKVVAPLAGHAAKHTSPGLGHKAVEALSANKVGPQAAVWAHWVHEFRVLCAVTVGPSSEVHKL